ncbi:MAG: hypothetical protein M0001_16345 [Treponema sp.]|nr:hypothetical protein [Treponema sp.]
MTSKNENVSREELYEKVWSEPISKIAPTYAVSGSYLARMCRDLNIPVPARGYWAQVQAGKKPFKPKLPPSRPGDATMWIRTGYGSLETDVRPIPPNPHSVIPPRSRTASSFDILLEAKERFDKVSAAHSGVHLHPRHRRMVDILTSQQNLDKSLAFAQRLFQRLQEYGFRVALTDGNGNFNKPRVETEEEIPKRKDQYYGYQEWRPHQSTVAYLGTVAIGLTIVEMTTKAQTSPWYTSTVPSGRYRLYAYSPYRHTELVRYWQDEKDSLLTARFDAIIAELEAIAGNIPHLIIEGERRAAEEQAKREAEHREYLRKLELEDREESEEKSRKALEQLIEEWAHNQSKLDFFARLDRSLDGLKLELRNELADRIAIARSLINNTSVVDLIRRWKTPKERFDERPSWRKE